ncbi:MAG: HNH endonuclease [Reyranellaceae bacterium]
MGVKAVWGRSSEPVMCFGSRGNPAAKDRLYFSQARNTAEKALTSPYLVTIGGGEHVTPGLRGKAIELVRVTGAYGETRGIVRDPDVLSRLSQWPVAVVLSEIYQIEGEPDLIGDLGFPDRTILLNAFDGVRRDDEQIKLLWNAMAKRPVIRRRDVPPLPHFRDPQKVILIGSSYSKVVISASEGEKTWRHMRIAERNSALAHAVKDTNRSANSGVIVCEACALTDANASVFDAHHLEPLQAGVRESRIDDFAVLCPTCHRLAHVKAVDPLQPLSISELTKLRARDDKTLYSLTSSPSG